MLVDTAGTRAISAQGWVDRGALWLFDAARGAASLIPVGDFAFLVPIGGNGVRFVVRAQRPDGGFVASVRAFAEPGAVLAEAELLHAGGVELRGDASAWHGLPRVFAGSTGGAVPYSLLVVAPDGAGAEAIPLDWFDERFDLDYQGMLTPLALPGTELVLIPVQRSSDLVVFDLGTRLVRGTVPLAGRGGNPGLLLRGPELWADDYDTLLRLRAADMTVEASAVLQPPDGAMGQFIGGWAFSPDGATLAVARPFSGDVVGVDPATLQITRRAPLGREPVSVAVLGDGSIVARDWKTGDLLRGALA